MKNWSLIGCHVLQVVVNTSLTVWLAYWHVVDLTFGMLAYKPHWHMPADAIKVGGVGLSVVCFIIESGIVASGGGKYISLMYSQTCSSVTLY